MRCHKKYLSISTFYTVFVAILLFSSLAMAAKIDGTLYYGGTIYTRAESVAEAKNATHAKTVAVLVADSATGKILFAGSAEDGKAAGYYDGSKILVDLEGKVMLPGFIDSHGHFPGNAFTNLYGVDLSPAPMGDVDTLELLYARMKARVDASKGGPSTRKNLFWITGTGYDDSLLKGFDGKAAGHPTAENLNKYVSDTVFIELLHISGHMKVVNQKALETLLLNGNEIMFKGFLHTGSVIDNKYVLTPLQSEANTSSIPNSVPKVINGVQIKDGKLTGLLIEMEAMGLLDAFIPKATNAQNEAMAVYGSQAYAAEGITTADQGASTLTVSGAFGPDIHLMRQMLMAGKFSIRLVFHPLTYNSMESAGAGSLKYANHVALAWAGAKQGEAAGTFTLADPAMQKPTDSRRVGNDLTRWDTGDGIRMGAEIEPHVANYDILIKHPDTLLLGTWKQIYDGSIQGYTGYLKDPGYYDKGTNAAFNPGGATKPAVLNGLDGSLNFNLAKLKKAMLLYHSAGQGVASHGNGSLANEDIVTAIEEAVALPANARIMDTRHTIIHAQMQERQMTKRLVGEYAGIDAATNMYTNLSGAALNTSVRKRLAPLMKAQNIVSSYFINHIYFWGNRHKTTFLGTGRANQMNPLGFAIAYDHRYTAHTDTPVTPLSQLRSVETAVMRVPYGQTYVLTGSSKDIEAVTKYPSVKEGPDALFWNYDQRITVLQALRAITINAAYSNKLDDRLGSLVSAKNPADLSQGAKYADLVVLSQDPFMVAPDTIADIRIHATLVANKLVYGTLPNMKAVMPVMQDRVLEGETLLIKGVGL